MTCVPACLSVHTRIESSQEQPAAAANGAKTKLTATPLISLTHLASLQLQTLHYLNKSANNHDTITVTHTPIQQHGSLAHAIMLPIRAHMMPLTCTHAGRQAGR